jgi:hypothetical protein
MVWSGVQFTCPSVAQRMSLRRPALRAKGRTDAGTINLPTATLQHPG